MADRHLFAEYQKPLVKLANNDYGREFLGISHEVKDKIVALWPNSYTIQVGRDKFRSVYRCYPLFANKLIYALTRQEISRMTPEYRMNKYLGLLNYTGILEDNRFPQVMLATTTVYTSAGDGFNGRDDVDSWANIRAQANGEAAVDGTAIDICIEARAFGGGQFSLQRSYYPFDTSTLASGATIQAPSTLSLYQAGSLANPDSLSLVLIQTTQASISSIALADYSALTLNSPTEGATRKTVASVVTNAYNDFALNASGLAFVNPGGNTKLGIRSNLDVDNSAPAGNNVMGVTFSEQTGTTQDPKLAITYTVGRNRVILVG